jgi:hypothetical protein
MEQFIAQVNIFTNINRKESYEQDSVNMCLNFSSFLKFCLAILYRVGAGAARAGAASKFLPGAGAA